MLLVLFIPATLTSQEETAPPPGGAEVPPLLAARDACFAGYRFGKIVVRVDERLRPTTLLPGQTVEVRGKIENPTDMPLPDGKLLASVLREDPTVAAAHWHPIVVSFQATGDYSLPPRGEVPFTVVWTVPENAPSGRYRVELSYLSGRYPLAGLPYVTYVPAAADVFTVVSPREEEASAVTFRRAYVTVNDQPYVFRAVPAPLSPGEPLRITAPIVAAAPQPVSVTVTAALYAWSSDTEGEPPMKTEETTLTLTPEKPVTVPFTWEETMPGAYEVVFTATPEGNATLPSVLKVRIPIAGFVPRLLFTGITGTPGSDTTVTTCVTNATLGTPENSSGSIETRLVADGQVLAEQSENFVSSSDADLFALRILVPEPVLPGSAPAATAEPTADVGPVGGILNLFTLHAQGPHRTLQGDVQVETVVRNGSGAVTDRDAVPYSAAVLAASPAPPQLAAASPTPSAPPRRVPPPPAALLIILLLVGSGVLLFFASQRRHGQQQ